LSLPSSAKPMPSAAPVPAVPTEPVAVAAQAPMFGAFGRRRFSFF